MWNRAELKGRAQNGLHQFYWGAVVVCLILLIATSEFHNGSSNSGGNDERSAITEPSNLLEWAKTVKNGGHGGITNGVMGALDDFLEPLDTMGGVASLVSKFIKAPVFVLFYTMQFVYAILILGFSILIGNLLLVGGKRYFMSNRQRKTGVGTIGFAFRSNYTNVMWTMLCVDIFTLLWTMLLVIPGIIKSYEYRMVPYILAENSGISRTRAFELSKEMMHQEKWNTFVLDISFVLWIILGAFTFSLSNIFYANPYMAATNAELYAHLRERMISEGKVDHIELCGF